MVRKGTSVAYSVATCIAAARASFSSGVPLGIPNTSIILLNAAVSSSTSASSSFITAIPFSAQSEKNSQRSSHPALCDERFATIVPNAAASAPIYADIEPPPGAGDSLAVSSAKAAHVMSTSLFTPFLSSASSMYSITFSSGLNSLRVDSPMLSIAMRTSSLSGTPVERFCLRRK